MLSSLLLAFVLAGPTAALASEPWVDLDYEAVGIDVLKGMCVDATCTPVDQAVVRSAARVGALGMLLDGRITRTGRSGAVALAGGWAHRAPRVLWQAGGMVQARISDHTTVAPGPWLSATVLPKAVDPRPMGLSGDLRNSELTGELRGGVPLAAGPTGPPDATGRLVWTLGSPELRAGVAVEVPLDSLATGQTRLHGGVRVEIRPTPRPAAPLSGPTR